MPTIPIHISPHLVTEGKPQPTTTEQQIFFPPPFENPLPQLLQTPPGLAILEIQGTINLPPPTPSESTSSVGQLVFPHYDPNDVTGSKAWMKTVHLYVGRNQRLTGEVKKLPKAIAVLRKREGGGMEGSSDGAELERTEELEMVEIVEWKVLFPSRPEPVGD